MQSRLHLLAGNLPLWMSDLFFIEYIMVSFNRILTCHRLLSVVVSASMLSLLSVFGLPMLLGMATASPAKASPSESIGPLEARSLGEIGHTVNLDEMADSLNSQPEEAEPEPVGLDLRRLPIIGRMIDDEGNLQFGRRVPVSVDFDDIEGGTSVMLEERFSIN
ncbi:MAG: hypothetical protein AB8B99_11185 [Phormidesmis sp.]